MAKRNIVVVGASAGGVQTLQELVSRLPEDFPAAIFIVLHIPSGGQSHLRSILGRASRLPVLQAKNNEAIETGRIYVAAPNRHMTLSEGRIRLLIGPRENFHRPAIDPLFRSAARVYGPRVIGIILSGLLDDGSAGLNEIERAGGIAVVQDPDEAIYPSMPNNAMESVSVHHLVRVADMPGLLSNLVQEDVADAREIEPGVESEEENTTPSVYSCPDCGGVLWEYSDPKLIRFRCRVGHAFSPESLLQGQSYDIERSLWTAMTALEETASFSRRLAARAWARGDEHTARHHEEKMRKAENDANEIKRVLEAMPSQDETHNESGA